MSLRINTIVLLFFGLVFNAQSQVREWSLDELIAYCLSNNYDVQIAGNQEAAADNLANRAQAGYLPSLNLNSGANISNNRTKLEFAGGIPNVERSGVVNTGLSAGLGLNYVLFNGFGRVSTYEMLMKSRELSEVESRVVAENAVFEVISRFLNLQQFELDLQALYQNRQISQERLKRVQNGVESGSRTGADLLAARIDFYTDSIGVLQQINIIEKEKAALNLLLGRNPQEPLFIKKELPLPESPHIEQLRERAKSNGASVLLAKIGFEMSGLQSKSIGASRYPLISLNAGYGLNSSQNGAGIVLSQNTLGLNAGLNFSMPLFNGYQLSNALKNARLEEDNSAMRMKQALQQIDYQLRMAELDMYELKSRIAVLETNVELAGDLVKRAELRFSNGQITYSELRSFQLQLLQSKNALHQANVQLALLYYGLLRLEGSLIR